jgi:hypothetical protein
MLFEHVAVKTAAQYVNHLFSQLYDEWNNLDDEHKLEEMVTPKLTSHSTRSGSATYADEHPHIQTQHIIQRGGWTVDGIQTVFNYAVGSFKTDSKVGRALSGWTSADNGGLIPAVDEFIHEPEEKASFKRYAMNLVGMNGIDDVFVNYLVTVLLMHYEEMKRLFNGCRLDKVMQSKALQSGMNEQHLRRWATIIKERFIQANSMYIPLSQFGDATLVSARDLSTFVDRTTTILENQHRAILNIHDTIRDFGFRLDALESKIELNHQELMQKLNFHPPQHAITPTMIQVTPLAPTFVDDQNIMIGERNNNIPLPTIFGETLKGYCINKLFFQWYDDKLYAIDTLRLNTKERKKFSQFAKCIFYMKKFLVDGTSIYPKPDNDVNEIRMWKSSMDVYSRNTIKAAVAFCITHEEAIELGKARRMERSHKNKTYVRPPPRTLVVRKRSITTAVSAMLKRFICLNDGVYPTPMVTDHCTSEQYMSFPNYVMQDIRDEDSSDNDD